MHKLLSWISQCDPFVLNEYDNIVINYLYSYSYLLLLLFLLSLELTQSLRFRAWLSKIVLKKRQKITEIKEEERKKKKKIKENRTKKCCFSNRNFVSQLRSTLY